MIIIFVLIFSLLVYKLLQLQLYMVLYSYSHLGIFSIFLHALFIQNSTSDTWSCSWVYSYIHYNLKVSVETWSYQFFSALTGVNLFTINTGPSTCLWNVKAILSKFHFSFPIYITAITVHAMWSHVFLSPLHPTSYLSINTATIPCQMRFIGLTDYGISCHSHCRDKAN